MILLKRVYEKYLVTDGKRVLVDRLWPRGIRRNTPNVDIWLKNIAPTDELRKWYMHDPKKWVEFKKRYLEELKDNKTVDQLAYIIESTDPVTLVYASSDTKRNNAIVLQHFMEKRVKKDQKMIMNGYARN
jgi:uncharacterized protein YeaO (DUF488 family)